MSGFGLLLRALVIRYAQHHLLRSIVTLVAVALGVASAYAIDLANSTAVASFSSSVNVIANRVNVQVLGTDEGFDERALLRVQTVRGVESASPVVSGDVILGGGKGFSGEVLRVIGIDITRATLPPGVSAAQDGTSSFDLHAYIDGNGVFVSRRIARAYHLSVGSLLHGYSGARAVGLRVAGIIPPNTVGVDSSVAFADIATAQTIFGTVGKLDRIDIVADSSHVSAVVGRLERVVPSGARVLAPKTRVSEISRMLASFTMNLSALAYVALLVGMYLIYNAVAISVVQRASEIGTLRALGAGRRTIFAIFIGEGALYGIAGSIGGLLLGAVLAKFSLRAVEATVSALYVGTHADAVLWSWTATIKAFALGTGLSMLAAALPAIGAAATAPARIMRNSGAAEQRIRGFTRTATIAGLVCMALAFVAARLPALGDGVPVFGYIAGVLAIVGASLEAPLLLALVTRIGARFARGASPTLAAAFLRASTRRISVAVASLMVAVAMMIAIAVLVGSFRSTIVAWTNDTLSADLYLSAPGAADATLHGAFPPSASREIAALPGVAAVDTFRGLDVPLDGRFAQLGATNFSSIVHRNKLRFLGNVDLRALARRMRDANDAVVSVPFETHFHLGPGDSFVIPTPSGPARFQIVAAYNDYSTSGGTFFIDDSTFVRLFHDRNTDSIAVYLAPGASSQRVRAEITHAIAPLHANIASNDELRGYALLVFDRTFAITNALYIISIVIAVLGVVSTLFALVLERRTDFALLRYVGLTRRGVKQVVFLQALVVGVLSAVLGVALGIGLAADLIYVINRQSFGWLIAWHSPVAFCLEAFGMVVVAAILSAVYPAAVASRIATAEVLRVE